MIEAVLDASALLAYLREEPGSDRVDDVLGRAVITSVNWAEVVQKSLSAGVEVEGLRQDLRALGLVVEPFSAGDAVLMEMAGRLRSALHSCAIEPQSAVCARLGGDEFAVLTLAPLERAEQVAERLRRALAAPLYVGEREITLTVSIGVALIDGGSNPLERADAQMYLAKRTAR